MRPIVLAALGVSVLAVGSAPARAAATIHVPADFKTIQAAVDAAADGDTIVVAKGKYKERVLISGRSGLTLQADGKAVIDAGGVGIAAAAENAPNLVLDGFTVQRTGGAGIRLTNCAGAVVRNCTALKTTSFGIAVEGSDAVHVTNCIVTGAKDDGIEFGISGAAVTNSFVTGCTVTSCKFDGIIVNGGSNTIEGDTVKSCKDNGIELSRSHFSNDCVIKDNVVVAPRYWGIYVLGNGDHVIDNHVTSSGSDSIEVNGVNHVISGNTLDKSKYSGIWGDAPGCTLDGNRVNSPKHSGIDMQGVNETVTNNVVAKSAFRGIEVNGTQGTYAGNTVTSCRTGFFVDGTNNSFTGNSATKSKKLDLDDESGGTSNSYDASNTFPKR